MLLPLLAAGLIGAAIVVGILLYLRPSAVATDPVATPAPAAINPATTPATAPAVVTQAASTPAATPVVTSAPAVVTQPAATSTAAPTATPGAAQRLENARRLLDDGKADQALPLLEAIRQQDPATPGLDETLVRAYVTRGQVALDQGDLDGGAAMFEKALTVRGDDENALTGRKRVEARRAWTRMEAAWGKDDDAVIDALETVRRNDPQYRSADVRDKLYVVRLGRAENLQKAGDLEGAAAEYQRAVELDPDRPEAKMRLQALTPTPTPGPADGHAGAVHPTGRAGIQAAAVGTGHQAAAVGARVQATAVGAGPSGPGSGGPGPFSSPPGPDCAWGGRVTALEVMSEAMMMSCCRLLLPMRGRRAALVAVLLLALLALPSPRNGTSVLAAHGRLPGGERHLSGVVLAAAERRRQQLPLLAGRRGLLPHRGARLRDHRQPSS